MRTVYCTSSRSTVCIDLIRNIYKTTAMISRIIVPPDSCIFVSKYQKIPKSRRRGAGRRERRTTYKYRYPLPTVQSISNIICIDFCTFLKEERVVGAADR